MNNLGHRLPLYEEIKIAPLLRENREIYQHAGNAGLLFDKFCCVWQEKWQLKERKSEWIRHFTKKRVGHPELIRQQIARMESLVNRLNGCTLFFQTEGRFVPGLGCANPVENGLAWHPTLGVPYLPGSSVKGILRNYVSEWEEKLQDREETLREIFGTPGQTGNLIFFDALPVEPVQLEIDIMNPHYSKYYQSPNEKNPTDWENPIPVPFLAVAPKQTYLFAFAPRDGKEKFALEQIAEWLKEALLWMGAGAKTAVGYGRFVLQEEQGRK